MPRIVYLAFPTGQVSGGQKMILRHVETLCDLGFDAVVRKNRDNVLPPGFPHRAPIEDGTPLRPDDVLVVPSDAPGAIKAVGKLPNRVVVFCQNTFDFAAVGMAALAAWPAEKQPAFLAVGPMVAAHLARGWPGAQVELVHAFADERVFRPGPERRHAIAVSPRKRPFELKAIRAMLARFHPRHAATPWTVLENATEAEVAGAFGRASVALMLSRFEAFPMTPLEAMASGALVAGFTGIGGRDYATADNGFWVDEDDCEGAADAVAQALDLALAGGPELNRRLEAAHATAARHSHATFVPALEQAWMRLAPDARRHAAPGGEAAGK